MLRITEYTVVNPGGKLDIMLPVEFNLDEATSALVTENDEGLILTIRYRVDATKLELVEHPGAKRRNPDGKEEPLFCLNLKDDQSPESVLANDLISGMSFLSHIPLSLSHKPDGAFYEAEDEDDRELLTNYGTNEAYEEISGRVSVRAINIKINADALKFLMPNRVGLRIYSEALNSKSEIAKFRELWRVLESAFARKNKHLVQLLSNYVPAQKMEFDRDEINNFLILRHRASHAERKKGIEELLEVGPQCADSLPRLENLVERVLSTKVNWGSPDIGFTEAIPVSGFVGPEKNAITMYKCPAVTKIQINDNREVASEDG